MELKSPGRSVQLTLHRTDTAEHGRPQMTFSATGTKCIRHRPGLWLGTAVASLLLVRPVVAQPEISARGTGPGTTTDLTDSVDGTARRVERISDQVQQADITEDARQSFQQQIATATRDLDTARKLQQKNAALKEQLSGLSNKAEELRTDPLVETPKNVEEMSLSDLEAQLASIRVRLTSDQQTLDSRREAQNSEADRKGLQEHLVSLEQRVTNSLESVQSLPQDSGDAETVIRRVVAEAVHWKVVAERDLTRSQLAELDARLSLNLPELEVASSEKIVQARQSHLKQLQSELERRRQQQSQEELQKAQQSESELASIQDPDIRELGVLRLKLAQENDQLTKQIPQWQQKLEARTRRLEDVKSRRDTIQLRVRRFGTGRTIGRELLNFQTSLPTLEELDERVTELDELTADLLSRHFDYLDMEQRARALAESRADTASPAEQEILESVPELLRKLKTNNRNLDRVLSDVNGVDLETTDVIHSWTRFTREHALWLRSHEPLTREDLQRVVPDVITSSQLLWENFASGQANGWSLWLLAVPAGLTIGLLLAIQSGARQRLEEQSGIAGSRTCTSMAPTLWAMLLSFGLAAEWPLFLLFVGSAMNHHSHSAVMALGRALIQLGGAALWLNFFRQIFRPGGLARDHLAWNDTVCTHLRRWLRLVLVVSAVPMLLLLLAIELSHESDATVRVVFILQQICSAVLLMRLLIPVRGPFVSVIAGSGTLLDRTRWVWITTGIAIPLALAVCSATGFHHTAMSLWIRLGWTVVVATGVVLCWSLVLRWLRVSHREMRMEQARERARQREDGESPPSENPLMHQAITDDGDILFYGQQARDLIRNTALLVMVGCAWGIWFDVLPALQGLNRVELWSVNEQIPVEAAAADGSKSITLKLVKRSVTAVSLLLVGFVSTATWIGVRQLPGLLEVILQRRTTLDAGVRYTVTTVVRYLLIIAGTIVVCQLLGLRWSQVQWLVAGLTVGLGFGLQEVFANFISGIIILVERPIRIGDVVTIDGVNGVVTRIQIRATSITDWDRREYIVPNRDLVTGKLLNWTLSDSTNRILIRVGIAYSCSPDRARKIMLQTAQEHPNVLNDPAPITTFENFGDSSLDLVLRAYLPDMDNRLTTITELHTQIHRSFAEAGIEIPFPQRDVHLLESATP